MNGTLCIDASVAAKWVLSEADSDRALALLREATASTTRLVGPPHLGVEVTSAITKHLRQGELTADEAFEQLRLFSRITLDFVSLPTLSERALELANEFNWSLPYDAFYLALGELLDCDVWTADVVFFRAAHNDYPRLRLLSDYEPTS